MRASNRDPRCRRGDSRWREPNAGTGPHTAPEAPIKAICLSADLALDQVGQLAEALVDVAGVVLGAVAQELALGDYAGSTQLGDAQEALGYERALGSRLDPIPP